MRVSFDEAPTVKRNMFLIILTPPTERIIRTGLGRAT